MDTVQTEAFFKNKVLGHPTALFVIFFTEMWERFSFYGMRALLVLFFTASLLDEGWGWPREHAMAIFGSYVGLVYLSTMMGGYFADNILGFRWAVVLGAFVMMLGHGAMALESPFFIYLGLTLLIIGNGFFKPNMTSMISELYKHKPEKKDGAYTIFYMGANAGAFFGILLCGYLGEKVGWSYGFGLAGIFMLFGLVQFWFARKIFGDIGLKPKKKDKTKTAVKVQDDDKRVPFAPWQKGIIIICIALGLTWIINDPVSRITEGRLDVFAFLGEQGNNIAILTAIMLFIILLAYRLTQYSKTTKDKLIAIAFFAFLTIFFWATFEQAPGTLTIFARDYTDRVLEGNAGIIFKIVDALMTIVPLIVITWVLILLFGKTFKRYSLSNIILAVSFTMLWIIGIWKIYDQYDQESLEVPASWFSTLNALFIITLAPLFSKWWESKYNPSANAKYGIGMFLTALGMACIAFGAAGIAPGAQTASVSMIWLILVYLFHTMGELCIAPVGLSYVSKLAPPRMIAFMFGVWYLALAMGMKGAGKFGENIDKIADTKGISYFFWLLTLVSLAVGVIAIVFRPVIKKLMHGVR